ncbi:MAG: YicC family protein [Firmicutes bacterium]|nr:YicC family protein [Bacillota bacterium]MCM1401644.1 YicC family protein [Bacteroides sp.]MCM1477530.1 YicC family protein [Bacteroides sp.]
MLLSMTGFGKSAVELPNKKITVEIKSLNSKQLDLSMRVAQQLRDKEMELRNIVARRVERGKVDVNIYVESLQPEATMQFNMPVLQEYKRQVRQMAAELDIPEPADWYSVLLRFPETFRCEAPATATTEDYEAASRVLNEAIDALLQYRGAEGAKLEEFFAIRIENIRNLLAQVPRYEVERVERIKARITDHLTQLPHADFDRSRLEQEMIFYIEKLDVNEEKQRLTQHLNYFMETLGLDRGQGKKLGFISQEMGREINTLGSKSNHAEMQKLVVRMKDELEQIKEQVLNVL